MKKNKLLTTLLLVSCSLMVVKINTYAAVKDSKDSTATFQIIENTEGTIIVESNNIEFGEHQISHLDINAKAIKPTSVKVTEFSGEKPGWTLKVKMSPFTYKKSPTETITAKGIKLFYPSVTPKTSTGGDAGSNPPIVKENDNSFRDSLKGTIVSDDNIGVELAGAVKGKGYGQWELPYEGDKVIQLKIPTGQQIGDYSSTVTYSAEDTPIVP